MLRVRGSEHAASTSATSSREIICDAEHRNLDACYELLREDDVLAGRLITAGPTLVAIQVAKGANEPMVSCSRYHAALAMVTCFGAQGMSLMMLN